MKEKPMMIQKLMKKPYPKIKTTAKLKIPRLRSNLAQTKSKTYQTIKISSNRLIVIPKKRLRS